MQYENKSITEIANCNIRLQMMEHHHNIIPSLPPFLHIVSTYLEVSIESPGVSLQLEGGEDEFVERTAVAVYQVQQFSVVSPGLQVTGKQTKG